MFASAFDEFERDPFFNFGSSPFKSRRAQSLPRQLKASEENEDRRLSKRSKHYRDALVPRQHKPDDNWMDDALAVPDFSRGFGGLFEGMNRMMQNMNNHMHKVKRAAEKDDFNGHLYSHSSVYSYSNDGKEEPRVYQAMSETRAGPGGVRETRKALRDSRTREEKMAVGRHIGDRGHTVEKCRIGDKEHSEDHRYFGVDENEGPAFDEEWRSKANFVASGFRHGARHRRLGDGRGNGVERPAIADSRRYGNDC